MKPTPGPWYWEADPVKGDPTGRVRYQVVATGKTVTRVYYSSFEGGPTNAEADARLIAAAPDLLSACAAAIAGYPGWHKMIHAAYEKATGEKL
jgi:hypothetical protein